MNNIEDINKIDAIAKAFEQNDPKCFFCRCDIDKSKDALFFSEKNVKCWICTDCNIIRKKSLKEFNIPEDK